MFSRINLRFWLVFLISAFYWCGISLAATPQEYYGRLFSSAGFAHVVSYVPDLLDEPLPKIDWLVVLSSDLKDSSLEDISVLPKKGTILICTAPYETQNFHCSNDSLAVSAVDAREVSLLKDYPGLGLLTFNSRKLFVIPESLLFTPVAREALTVFLNEYTHSIKLDPHYVNHFSQLVTPFNTWVLQFFSYSLWGIVIGVVLYGFWLRFSSTNVDFSQLFDMSIENVKKIFNWTLALAQKYHLILGLLLLFGLVALGVLSSVLSLDILHMLQADRLYASLVSLKSNGVHVLISVLSLKRLFFYSFLFLYVLILVLYMLPVVVLLVRFILDTFIFTKTSRRRVTLSPYTFLIFVLGALLFSSLASLPVLLPILFVFLLIVLYVTRICEIRLTLSHLIVFYCLTLVLLLVSVPLRHSLEQRAMLFRRPIFGRVSPIILLPYEKTFSSVEHFSSFKVEDFAYPLFLDQWTIYYPGVSTITTRDISEFGELHDLSSYLILGMSRSGFIKVVLKNDALRNAIVSPDFSPVLYVQVLPVAHAPKLYASVLIDCALNPSSGDIKVQPYTKFDVSLYPSFDLLHFAGCSEDEVSSKVTKSFLVPLDLDLSFGLNQLLFVEGPDNLIASIESFTVKDLAVSDTPSVYAYYLEYAPKYKILLDHAVSGYSNLEVYANVPEAYKGALPLHTTFTLPLDLGVIAEDLRTHGLLSNPFVIWSSLDGVIIRNSFEKP